MNRLRILCVAALLAACLAAAGATRMAERRRSEVRLILGTLVPQVYETNPTARMEKLLAPELLRLQKTVRAH